MRKLINALTMTAAIFMLSTAAPAETYAASRVKPWTNGRLVVTADHRYLQFENGQPDRKSVV